MISIKTQTNLGSAKSYFREHLNSGDYYQSGGQTPGRWHGLGAGVLGLSEKVAEADFLNLCHGLKPDGSKLTKRMNTMREGDVANRRVFFDFTICPPKSISIAALVAGDDRIKQAHANAVAITARELETFACTRVRSKLDSLNGQDRKTSNLIMAEFTHETSRTTEEGGTPDPLLHSHLLCFNATKDDDQWKALQPVLMFRAQKYIESVYDHELCRQLKQLGYQIRENSKGWELDHIPDTVCARFSKRRKAILAKTAELENQGAHSSHEKIQDMAAHDQRIRKQGSQSADSLRTAWLGQMTKAEVASLAVSPVLSQSTSTPGQAVAWAERHLFERSAVVRSTDFLSSCLRFARGGNFTLAALKSAFASAPSLLREVDGDRLTTERALETEACILRTVDEGKGQYPALAPGLLPSASALNPLQKQAAEKLLASRDFCSVFRGGAGTGKSYTLRHVRDALVASGKNVMVLAPQNQQIMDLQKDGFTAQTVSSFLSGTVELDSNSVLICDEAGQVGGEDMGTLLAIVKTAGARIILSGDSKQHGSIARSSALQAIQKYASPHTSELSGEFAIQRQTVEKYKQAVAAAELGDTARAWELLESLGSIRDTTLAGRTADAASLYLEKMHSGGTVLLVSQTNAEVDALNLAVREKLIESGKLNPSIQTNRETLRALDLTNAQKEKSRSYPENAVVLLNRKVGRHLAGTPGQFLREGNNGGVVLMIAGQEQKVPHEDLGRLTICEQRNLDLCGGDKIQLKANCKIGRTKKLANGQIVTILRAGPHGGLLVMDGYGQKFELPADFKMFQLGYAVSSYGSQGKTVDHVIVSDASCKAATSQKEFYVSISRARTSCTILTADRASLQDHIKSLGERDLASDLVLEKSRQQGTGGHENSKMGNVSGVDLQRHQRAGGAREQAIGSDRRTGERIQFFKSLAGKIFRRGLVLVARGLVRWMEDFDVMGLEREAENSF